MYAHTYTYVYMWMPIYTNIPSTTRVLTLLSIHSLSQRPSEWYATDHVVPENRGQQTMVLGSNPPFVCVACKRRRLQLSNGWNQIQRRIIFGDVKMIQNSNFSVHKNLLGHSPPIPLHDLAALVPQQQRWAGTMKIPCQWSPKHVLSGPLQECLLTPALERTKNE